MRIHAFRRAAGLLLVAAASGAFACSPPRGWRPPSAAEAFARAEVVVHGVVSSERVEGHRFIASLAEVRLLKGAELPANEVRTTHSAACGIGRFRVGEAHVFFLHGGRNHVSLLRQPRGAASDVLEALRSAGLVQ